MSSDATLTEIGTNTQTWRALCLESCTKSALVVVCNKRFIRVFLYSTFFFHRPHPCFIVFPPFLKLSSYSFFTQALTYEPILFYLFFIYIFIFWLPRVRLVHTYIPCRYLTRGLPSQCGGWGQVVPRWCIAYSALADIARSAKSASTAAWLAPTSITRSCVRTARSRWYSR